MLRPARSDAGPDQPVQATRVDRADPFDGGGGGGGGGLGTFSEQNLDDGRLQRRAAPS